MKQICRVDPFAIAPLLYLITFSLALCVLVPCMLCPIQFIFANYRFVSILYHVPIDVTWLAVSSDYFEAAMHEMYVCDFV